MWDGVNIGSFNSGQFLDGSLSNFRIWNTARTGAEVESTYNQTLTGTQNGDLVVNYVMDELTGTSLEDEAGGDSNGTVVGSPTIVDVAPSILDSTLMISEGETATGTMTASDVVGTATYTVSGLVASDGSISIDSSSGQWTYTPPANWAGTATFNVIATGATSGTDTEAIAVTVTADAEMAVHGGALQLDGVNDHVVVEASSSLQFGTSDFSIEGWIKLDQLGKYQALVDTRGATNLHGYMLGVNTSNLLQFYLSDGADGTDVGLAGGTSLAADTWYHVAVTVDRDGNATLHTTQENGTTTATTVSVAGETGSIGANDLYIGKQSPLIANTSYGPLKGQVDELRFWNDLRTTREIADNFNEQIDPASAGLVANYRFDDASGSVVQDQTANNNDGQIRGVVTGPTGNVLQLDGVDDYLDVNNIGALTTTFTLESWVNLDSYEPGTDYGIVMDVAGTTGEVGLQITNAGFLDLWITGIGNITSTYQVSTGEWAHLAVTYDGANAYLYANGVQVGTLASGDMTALSGTINLNIGKNDDTESTNYIDGQLDNVRVWSSARTIEEIRDGMTQSYDYETTNLLGQYTFDDVSNNWVIDNTTTRADGYLTNGAAIVDSGSTAAQFINHLGNALSFDGTDDLVTFTSPVGPAGSAARTLMMWVKTSSDAAQQMISYGSPTIPGSFGVGFNSFDGKGVSIDIHGAAINYQPLTATNDGQWHHYAVVVPSSAADGTVSLRDLEVYQDGVRLNTVSVLASNNDSTFNTGTGNLRFGSYIDGADDFNGQMAEASIWSTALTAAQVRTYMTRSLNGDESGLEGYWKLDEEPGATTAADSSQNNHTGTLSGNAAFVDTAPSIEGSQIEIAENSSASGQMTDTDVTGTPTYTLIGSPHLGTVDLDAVSGQWTYTPNADTQGNDSFTIRATGATSGIDEETVAVDIGKDPTLPENYGLLFDGTNDYVDLGDAGSLATGTGAFTYELWVKSSVDNARQDLISIGDRMTGNSAFLHIGDTGLLEFDFFGGTGPASTTKVADGAWHHVGVTYSAGTVQLYVDGAADGSQSGFSGIDIKDTLSGTSGGTHIGVNNDGSSQPFNGEIAEARIWNAARSSTDIANHFDSKLNGDEAGLVGYWDFDEGAGTIAADRSGNANDGVLTNGATYKNLTTVAMGNAESYKGMILGEDADADNLSYAVSSGASLSGFTLTDNTYTYVSHATNDGTNEVSIDITDDNGDVTTETLSFVVS